MSKVVVARPVDGITINDELEFVLDEKGGVRIFGSARKAKRFLRRAGVSVAEMQDIKLLRSYGTCSRCGSPLFESRVPGYKYQCFTCDEDFYAFEQEGQNG